MLFTLRFLRNSSLYKQSLIIWNHHLNLDFIEKVWSKIYLCYEIHCWKLFFLFSWYHLWHNRLVYIFVYSSLSLEPQNLTFPPFHSLHALLCNHYACWPCCIFAIIVVTGGSYIMQLGHLRNQRQIQNVQVAYHASWFGWTRQLRARRAT
jgi:hypothetical protein